MVYGLYGWTGTPFIYMRNQKAHAGFPEISYGKFSSILVNAGYKVARVEQVNKADGKLVNRAVVTIITPGKEDPCSIGTAPVWYCTCWYRDVIWSIEHTMERLGELCFLRAILWYLSF
jgi:hypothetical protein